MRSNRAMVVFAVLSLLAILWIGCGHGSGASTQGGDTTSGGGGGGGTTDPSDPSGGGSGVAVKGQFDASTLSVAGLGASGALTVDRVIALSGSSCAYVEATIQNNEFTLSLPRGYHYIVVFLNGAAVQGIYEVDIDTGLSVFPIDQQSLDIDLGTVSQAQDGTIVGTITEDQIFAALGIDKATAEALGWMDNGMRRLSSLDVDGNGTIDCLEGKNFDLVIDFEFTTNASFAETVGAYASPSEVAYRGYMYYFFASPRDGNLDWTNATLHSPTAINGGNDKRQCWNTDDYGQTLNFYCGGEGVSPATPPAGTYRVEVGGTRFTFINMKTQTIDADLVGVYFPSPKLTLDGSGKVQTIEWTWWKKEAGGWVQPTQQELELVLDGAGYEFGRADWAGDPNAERVRGDIDLTPTGSVQVPTQSFATATMRMTYRDKSGFSYGFEWH